MSLNRKIMNLSIIFSNCRTARKGRGIRDSLHSQCDKLAINKTSSEVFIFV